MNQLVEVLSGSVTVTSTFRYSNPATKYLTETNSEGVVTGMPENTATNGMDTAVVTAQPPVATIPAGISGTTVIYYNASTGLTSFTVDGQSTTTNIIGEAGGVSTTAGPFSSSAAGGSPTGGSGNNGGGNGGNGNGNGNGGNGGGSPTGAAAASSSTGAAVSNAQIASAGIFGLGAFFAALL
jgi:hypothetical protein